MNKRRNTRILQVSIGLLICMHALSSNYSFLHNLRFGSGIDFTPMFATEAKVSRAHYDIRIVAINGQELDLPLYFSESSADILTPGEYSRESGMRLIKKFGYAIATQSDEKVDTYQSELHENYFNAFETVRYELVMYPYQPPRFDQVGTENRSYTSVTLLEAALE